MNLNLWLPEIFNFKGGIQTYSIFLLNAVQALYPHINHSVFLKHDTRTSPQVSYLPHTSFSFTGQYPSRVRTSAYAAQLISQGIWQKPDLVIATHLNFTLAGYWLKQIRQVPYWAVAHGVDAWDITNSNLIRALQHADRILAVSHYTRDRLLKEQDLDPEKVVLLPNTFDSNRFQIGSKPAYLLKRHQINPNQPIILTVARLASEERYKGYDQILQALPKIRQHIPDIHYVLAGKGSDRPRIEQLITQLDLQDCVTLAGFVPDEELCDYYNLCDVFAMPSKGEGFGIVYLEALACGKPTIGGNQDGALDALCQGELGALVDPNDIDAIAHTLTHILQGTYNHPILDQPQLLRQKVIETFGFDRFQKTLDELLQNSPISPQRLPTPVATFQKTTR
jgi:glycosyltransferase involved in cell wall biosynthesis